MINYIIAPFKWFFKLEAASGLVLLIAAVIALILSNTNLSNYYCTTFKEHGYDCIPIFQVLAPAITVEPHDIVSQQWTIFRVLN